MKKTRFLTAKQKIATFIAMFIAYANPYTLASSYAELWWDNVSNVSDFDKTASVLKEPVMAALEVAAPLCKTYCLYFFPIMCVLNLILMATTKDDKAMGMCKTALITEIVVLFLMICIPSLLYEGVKATGAGKL